MTYLNSGLTTFQSLRKKTLFKNKDYLVIIIIFLLSFLFFFKGFQGKILWGHDTSKISFPFTYVLDESIKNHKLQLWLSDILFGFPIGAEQGQYAIFYPPNLVHAILPLATAVALLSFLHLAFAGTFTYLFAKKLKISKASSLMAAIVYMYSGFIIAHAQYPSHIYAYTYLPLSLLLVEIARQKKSLKYFALIGSILGLQFLTGHPNIPVMTLVAIMLYILTVFWKDKKFLIQSLLLIITTLLLVSLPYFVQLATLVPLSSRASSLNFIDATNSSLSIYDFITFLFPKFFLTSSKDIWNVASIWHNHGYWGQIETIGYVGISTLLLSFFGFSKKYRKYSRPIILLLFVGFVFAMGKYSPIYKHIVLRIPIMNGLRAPSRYLMLIDFSLAILAAFGLDYIISTPKKKKNKILVILAGIPICISVITLITHYLTSIKSPIIALFINRYPQQVFQTNNQFWEALEYSFSTQTLYSLLFLSLTALILIFIVKGLKKKVFIVVVPLIVALDLVLFATKVNSWKEPSELLHRDNQTIKTLNNNVPSQERVYTFNYFWSDLLPNQLVPHHATEANGFVSMHLQRYLDWQKVAEDRWSKKDPTLFEIGSILYIYNDSILTKTQNSLPRTYVANTVDEYRNSKSAFEKLISEEFDPRKNTIIEVDGDETLSYINNTNTQTVNKALIEIYEPEYVRIKANTDKPGVLVLTDTYYPGWKAKVNGLPKKIYQTNYLFRGVEINKGENIIEMTYSPPFIKPMLMVSIVTLAGSAIAAYKESKKHV